ncbi:MAG: hypothetical protein AAGD25_00945 [Cyanobacteria bacterium P01_F01_bin.150]
MDRSQYRTVGNQPHFVTCTTTKWIPIFSAPKLVQILFDLLDA